MALDVVKGEVSIPAKESTWTNHLEIVWVKAALWGLIFALKACVKSKMDCSNNVDSYWGSIPIWGVCILHSHQFFFHNVHNGPNTWPIVSCVNLRASSWFNVSLFIFHKESFIYGCINTRCPFDSIGNRVFTDYFFTLYPYLIRTYSEVSV